MTTEQNQAEVNYQKLFLEIRPQLSSYLYRLTANKQDMDDLLQDTYIKISDKISSFRGESSFKTWVFAVATNLARDNRSISTATADRNCVCEAG